MLSASRIIVFVKDIQVMASFYQDVLGLSPIVSDETSADFIVLDAGAIELCLHKIPTEFATHIHIENPAQARDATPLKLVFTVDDVAAYRDALLLKGVPMQARMHGDTYDYCDGNDPEGNIFQIACS